MADIMLDGLPIAEATEEKLQAAAYTKICALEQLRMELQVLQQELARRQALSKEATDEQTDTRQL